MDQVNGTLEMLVGRDVLVVRAGGAVIGETEPMPVLEMHVQQSLIRAVEANAAFCQRLEGKIILQVGAQHHQPAVEAIRPANVRDGGEIHLEVEQLVGGPERHNVTINIYNAPELRLSPELDLGKRGYQVRALHQPEVGRGTVRHRVNGDQFIVNRLGEFSLGHCACDPS